MVFVNLLRFLPIDNKMKKFLIIFCLALFIMPNASAQNKGQQDVFIPISKYIESGNYEKLSAWFADNLELDILGTVNNCTKNQAKLIMKNYFTNYTPKKFTIMHKSGRSPMNYAVGSLNAGGDKFRVIIFVKTSGESNYIQQLRIEKE